MIRVSKTVLSVTVSVTGTADVEELQRIKGRNLRFVLDAGTTRAWFDGRIASCGVRRNAFFVLHTGVKRAVVMRLLEMRKAEIAVKVFSPRPERRVVPFMRKGPAEGTRITSSPEERLPSEEVEKP